MKTQNQPTLSLQTLQPTLTLSLLNQIPYLPTNLFLKNNLPEYLFQILGYINHPKHPPIYLLHNSKTSQYYKYKKFTPIIDLENLQIYSTNPSFNIFFKTKAKLFSYLKLYNHLTSSGTTQIFLNITKANKLNTKSVNLIIKNQPNKPYFPNTIIKP